MNQVEYLLGKIAEECCEIGQRAIKAQRFGIHEVQPGQALSNFERLRMELADLAAVCELLSGVTGVMFHPLTADVEAHKGKVRQYMAYSKQCGTLENWDRSKEFQPEVEP